MANMSKKVPMPSGWFLPTLIFIAVSLVTRTQSCSPVHNSSDHSPEGGSRLAFSCNNETEVPPWLMTFHNVKPEEFQDGTWSGVGIRVSSLFFLAHMEAMVFITRTLEESKKPRGPPGLIKFNPPVQLDISRLNGYSFEYAPMYNKTVAHGIGIYWPAIREGQHEGRFLPAPEAAKTRFPLTKAPPLATQISGIEDEVCRVITYGSIFGAHGFDNPIRKLLSFNVRKLKCKDHLCRFRNPEWPGGKLCGKYSELGSPIMCGQGEQKKLSYIVTEVAEPRGRVCSHFMMALEVGAYAKEIMDHVAKYDK